MDSTKWCAPSTWWTKNEPGLTDGVEHEVLDEDPTRAPDTAPGEEYMNRNVEVARLARPWSSSASRYDEDHQAG